MILFGEDSLRKSIQEFTAHYHFERNHQGLGNRLIMPDSAHAGKHRRDPAARAARWDAQLLLSRRRVSNCVLISAMDMINRSAIVVRPAQPFLDWLHRVDSTSRHLTLDRPAAGANNLLAAGMRQQGTGA